MILYFAYGILPTDVIYGSHFYIGVKTHVHVFTFTHIIPKHSCAPRPAAFLTFNSYKCTVLPYFKSSSRTSLGVLPRR